MPGLAPKSGWNEMRPRLSHLISCCITVIVQSVGTVELQKVHLYSRAAWCLQPWQVLAPTSAWSAQLRAGAGAHQLLALAPAPEDRES